MATREPESAHPPEAASSRRIEQTVAGRILVVLAGAFIVTYLGVALLRLRYPFALEWIEGGLLDEVRWIRAGHKPYGPPNLEFVPFIYNPLYFWVAAGFTRLLGVGFFAMRLVSFLASLGTMTLLGLLVHKETASRSAALIGAGLFAATFKTTDQFMDLARVDSLYVLFAILALFLLRTNPTPVGRTTAALSLVLCFLTKQSGALIAAPLVAWIVFVDARGATTWRARLGGAPFAIATFAGIAGSVWLLNRWTDDWYGFYAFKVPAQHRFAPQAWLEFWTADLLPPFACGCVGALFVLLDREGMEMRVRGLWAAALLGAIAASWSGRLHIGGWNNVMMPTFALLSALLAVALHRGFTLAGGILDGPRRASVQAAVLIVGIVQMVMHAYDPRRVVPKKGDEEAGRAVVAILSSAPGDVFVPSDSYLAAMAGKRPCLHQMATADLARAPGRTSEVLMAQIKNALGQHRWSMIITDNDWLSNDVAANYTRTEISVPGADTFFPVAGLRYRPGWVFTPK